MKKILALAALLLATPALAADNIPVTVGSGTPIRSTDTSAGATGAGPYVNWYTLSTSGAAGTAPVVLYGTAGTPAANPLTVQGIASMTPILATVTGTVTANQGGAPWSVTGTISNASSAVATGSTNVGVNGYGYGFNGTTWDQLQVDASKFLKVNCSAGCSASTSITGWAGGTLGAMANYGTSPGAVLVPGVNAFVTNSNANGRNTSGNSSPVVPVPALTTFHLVAANSNNATSVKASPATLHSCQMSNNSTTMGFFKIFNKASAPTMGTDTPVWTGVVPGPAAGGGGSNVEFGSGGLTLNNGFAIAITPLITDLDSTSVPAATIVVNCQYE